MDVSLDVEQGRTDRFVRRTRTATVGQGLQAILLGEVEGGAGKEFGSWICGVERTVEPGIIIVFEPAYEGKHVIGRVLRCQTKAQNRNKAERECQTRETKYDEDGRIE